MKWVRYQREYLADRSPRKVVLKSRRIGFSEVMAFEAACRAVGVEMWPDCPPNVVKPVPQNIVSASQRQAIVFLEKVMRHVKALGMGMVGDIVERESVTLAKLTNGATLTAFSSNPKSIRGDGGDVTWDETASTPRDKEVWAALRPLATANLGERGGYHIRIASTPLGDDNLFHDFCRGDMRKRYSLHEVDWRAAMADGFPFDEAAEREEYPDPDIFAQEFELSFLSSQLRYISTGVYDAAAYDIADLPKLPGERFGGMDVARHRDNSAIVQALRIADTLYHEETEARRGVEWSDQEAWVRDVVNPEGRAGMLRFCVDKSGLGSQFAERLELEFPGTVEGVGSTPKEKDDLATGLKLALASKRFRPRRDDVDLRRDVLNLRRVVTAANNVRYDAPRDKSGHADRAIAAALCVHAAGGAAKRVGNPTRAGTVREDRAMGRSRRMAGRNALRGV